MQLTLGEDRFAQAGDMAMLDDGYHQVIRATDDNGVTLVSDDPVTGRALRYWQQQHLDFYGVRPPDPPGRCTLHVRCHIHGHWMPVEDANLCNDYYLCGECWYGLLRGATVL